ncbi:MAG: DUF1254 domain-containing protein [Planctomycetaceae bacterium]|nr:DUF1254 domain-containing protein [Planctomycetaceae bacterium]
MLRRLPHPFARRFQAFLLTVIAATVPAAAQADTPTAAEIDAIAKEAYQYLYPLITMEITRLQSTNIAAGKIPGRGPMNAFAHIREYPTADFRGVVRPNFDTLYSSAWLDLTSEPVIVSSPDTQGRYFLLPMLDMWSDVFAVPGKRTTGTAAAEYVVCGPGWNGALPAGLVRIDAPTPYVWLIGRTQTNGPADYDAVHKVQDGYTITPLSQRGQAWTPPAPTIDPDVDMKTPPLDQVNSMTAERYFTYGMKLMALHPPHAADWSIVACLRRLGLSPSDKFDYAGLPAETRAALERGVVAGLTTMKEKIPTLARVVNGWSMNTDTMGVYGDYYLKRAIVAMVGLGANQCEDAVYPMCLTDESGRPLVGEAKYVLHFEKDQLPPVDAFWSVTMYDADGFQIANPLNRFAIGDRDSLKYAADGSLDLYLQHDSPGPDKESNWLPSPAAGVLGVTMRLYAPRASVLEGRWAPPPVKRVE